MVRHQAALVSGKLTRVTSGVNLPPSEVIMSRGLHSLIVEGFLKDNHGMMQVSVEDIQQNLIVYLQRVEAGETLVIVRAGQPVVEMKPVKTGAETLRPFGLCAGEFAVPEDFDAPLPEDILRAFEGL